MSERIKPKVTFAKLEKAVRSELKNIGIETDASQPLSREDVLKALSQLQSEERNTDFILFIAKVSRHLSDEHGDIQFVEQTRYIELRNCLQDISLGVNFFVNHGKKGLR